MSETITLGLNRTVSCVVSGPEQAEAVLLLGGLGCNAAAWQTTRATLEVSFRVWSYDLDWDMGVADQAEEFLNVLNRFNVARLHVVAHSCAAPAVLRALASEPQRALSLALSSAAPRLDVALSEKLGAVLQAARHDQSLGARVARPWLLGAVGLERGVVVAADARVLLQQLNFAAQLEDERKWLRAVTCPCLVVVGSDDHLTPMRYSHEVVEWVKAGLGVLVTVTGAGHLPMLEQPEEWQRMVFGFLSRYQDFASNAFEDDEDDGAEYHDISGLQ